MAELNANTNDFVKRSLSSGIDNDSSALLFNLNSAVNSLSEFSSNSENTFLEIGSKLQNYLKSLRSISENSSKISYDVSEEILKKGIKELEVLLEEVSAFLNAELNKIIENKNSLRSADNNVIRIKEHVTGFNKIIKHLRMLGISTKIESSRLSLEDAGFFTLAENVDRLSNVISEKISSIKSNADYLNNALTTTITDLTKLESEQHSQSEFIISRTQHSLNSFKEKSSELSDNAKNINVFSQNAAKSINEIVSSIQFHDISRQQIEHSLHAIGEAQAELSNDPKEEKNSKETFGSVYDLCSLQEIQLANTLNEFENAVSVIMSNLKNLGDSVSLVLKHTFGFNDSGNTVKLSDIESELLLIAGVINKNAEIGEKLAESIKSIVGILDELYSYVNEIEEVGSEIEIIALNARVKAARFGTNGSALGVLSESIQKLSLEAKEQSASTSALLAEIMNESQKLKKELDDSTKSGDGDYSLSTIETIHSLIGSMKNVENESQLKATRLQVEVHDLNTDILNTNSKISIQVDAREKIGAAIALLNECVNSLSEKYDFKSDRLKNTKMIFSKYTMQSERDIHLNFTGDMPAQPGLPGMDKLADSGDGMFDDNIELF